MTEAVAAAFKAELLALTPSLRAFARSLARDRDRADDLVQETLVKAWEKQASYAPGSNMRAWLFTILRNNFYSGIRKYRREVEDIDDARAARLSVQPSQIPHIEMEEFKRALGKLNPEQREALVLIGVSGFTYEEAAEICGCAIGTVKSRVNRARTALTEVLEMAGADAPPQQAVATAATAQSPTRKELSSFSRM